MFWFDDVIVTSSLLGDFRQVSSLLLSSNNKVSSFCWTRESQHSFLTNFSYFCCYFLIIVFGQLLLSSFFVPFLAAWKSDLSFPVSHTSGTLRYCIVHAPLCFWHRLHCFSWSKTLWDPGSRLGTRFFPFSLFA
jgi:hypothetical protein